MGVRKALTTIEWGRWRRWRRFRKACGISGIDCKNNGHRNQRHGSHLVLLFSSSTGINRSFSIIHHFFSRTMWIEVSASEPVNGEEDFRTALKVWIDKPHTINRRLAGVKPISENVLASGTEHRSDEHLSQLVERLETISLNDLRCFLNDHTRTPDRTWKETVDLQGYVLERDLLPKQIDRFKPVRELVVVFSKCAVFFNVTRTPVLSPSVTYRLRLGSGNR